MMFQTLLTSYSYLQLTYHPVFRTLASEENPNLPPDLIQDSELTVDNLC